MNNIQYLQPNTTLQGGKYRIERMLGQGGFGITYLAVQVAINRYVAIKEFFIKESCQRDVDNKTMTVPSYGSKQVVDYAFRKFRQETIKLASLSHPNIVRVIDVFEENGTAYYVMNYLPGGSLSDYVKTYGPMSEDWALGYVRQIASALKYMHTEKHMCHLDVKPGNIMLDGKGHAFLIDFGISKNYGADGRATSSMPVGFSEGYAPVEQYSQMVSDFSPAIDVYGLGATLFFLLHGQIPVNAPSRVGGAVLQLNENLSQEVKNIINASMAVSKTDRAQSMDVFLQPQSLVSSFPPHVHESPVSFIREEPVQQVVQPLPVGQTSETTIITSSANNRLEQNTSPKTLQKTIHNNKKNQTGLIFGALFAFILLLCGIGGAIYYFYLRDKGPDIEVVVGNNDEGAVPSDTSFVLDSASTTVEQKKQNDETSRPVVSNKKKDDDNKEENTKENNDLNKTSETETEESNASSQIFQESSSNNSNDVQTTRSDRVGWHIERLE